MTRNLVMDLQDTGTTVKYLIRDRDRDSRATAAFDAVLANSGITTITIGIRVPRMNAIMERWIRTCRTELLDRTLILNQVHLLHALREFETFYHDHRTPRPTGRSSPWPTPPHRSPNQADWITSSSDDVIDSAASSTSTTMPPDPARMRFSAPTGGGELFLYACIEQRCGERIQLPSTVTMHTPTIGCCTVSPSRCSGAHNV
jgi:hypothetical protein